MILVPASIIPVPQSDNSSEDPFEKSIPTSGIGVHRSLAEAVSQIQDVPYTL